MAANARAVGPETAPTPPVPGGEAYAVALRGMVDRPFCASQKYGEQQGRADRVGAQKQILDFERKLVRRFLNMGVPLFAHCVVRGDEEQNRLLKAGVSKAGAGESPHNYGAAVDLIHGTKAWALSREQWAIIGHVGKEVAAQAGIHVTWGGDDGPGDKFNWDPAHWELTEWRVIRRLYGDGESWARP